MTIYTRQSHPWVEDGTNYRSLGNACWYTNLVLGRLVDELKLSKKYSNEAYPRYDNYDAINVDKVKDIPIDYYGVMGVPITFLSKHNPSQFEILGHEHDVDGQGGDVGQFELNGKGVYKRILIRRRK